MSKKITKFESHHFTDIREEIQKALDAIGAKYDISMKLGNISYTHETFTSKITAATKTISESGESIEIDPKWKKDFIRNAYALGLKPTDFGKKFMDAGIENVIVGAAPRKDVVYVQRGAKFFQVPAERVSRLINKGE